MASFDRAVRRRVTDPNLFYYRAVWFVGQEDRPAALREISRALLIDPAHRGALRRMQRIEKGR